jgi:hypothetical protein
MMKRYYSFPYLTCLFIIYFILIWINPGHGATTPAHKASTETSNHQINLALPEKAEDSIKKSTIQKPENLVVREPLSVKVLKETSWWTTVQKNIKEQEYRITYQDASYLPDIKGTYQAPNRNQNLRTYFTSKGIKVVSRTESVPTWHADFTLSGLGKESSIVSLPEDKEPKVNEHRIEFHRADVVEWYENRPYGLEQGFTINKKPEGNGPLYLFLDISGNVKPVLSKDGRTVNFLSSKDAKVLQYGNLKAFDAKGKALPSRFEFAGNLLKIVVDDSAANYPIVVDPLLTTPAWTAESDQSGANFGYAVSTAGDVNGDGFSDVIVGADQFDTAGFEGKVFVYYGSVSGLSTTADWTAVSDQASPTYFGTSVDTAGDVNGDGYDDIIIGADYYDNPGPAPVTDGGKIFVYYGSASGLSTTADWTAESDQVQSYFGWEVSTAGDVNNDGYDDIIVGAIGYDSMAVADVGAAYVYYGSATGLGPNGTLTNADWSAVGTQANEGFGNTVDTARDVNGDGYSDVIVGAPFYSSTEAQEGSAFVYHGSASGLSTTANWTAESNQAGAQFGTSVRSAGDVNGDGYSDVIIGAWNYNATRGGAFVYHGSATGLGPSGTPANADWSAIGGVNYALGTAVSTAGDVNGDGYSDVIVGAPGDGDTLTGWAYVYYGSASGLSTTADWTQAGVNTGDNYGFAVSTAGDVNGDGFSDVIIGANYYDNGQTDEGAAYLYYGSNISPGTYYVDISQFSEGDGSAGNPWKTLHYAIQQINSGDPGIYTLNVATGTYSVPNGEADATLVINQDNVTIQGAGAGSTIINGIIDSTWQIGIEINASNVTISGCEVRNFTMNGINIYTGTGQIVEDCDIHDNDWGIYTNNTSPEIRKNKIYDNTIGIYITVFDGAAYAPVIKNNLIYTPTGTMEYGIEVYAASTGSTASPSIYHNTIDGGTLDGIYIREEMTPPAHDIKFNIITNFAQYGIHNDITFSGNPVIDYNDVWNNTGSNYNGCTAGTNDISSDPSFLGGGDYNLQSGSPCIDAIPTGEPPADPVSDDLEGNTRPQGSGYDMGCYESSGAPAQYTLTVTIVGQGTVTLDPAGGTYDNGTLVTLTAVPDSGCNFMGWSGALTGSTNPETITMNADKTVTATFNCPPDTPTASGPGDEAILSSGPVTIDTSIFSDPDSGDTHTESHWLVRRADSVYYRIDYDTSFNVVSTSDLTQHTVSGLNSGMKYVWKVGYTDSGSGETSWSEEYSFKIGTSEADSSVEINSGTEEADFTMVSFVQWPDNPMSSSVFDLTYNKKYFRIGTYDPTNGSGGYVEYGSSLMIEPGKAYWFLARDGLPITVNGIPVSLLDDIDVGLLFNASNQNGWNMIGCPNAANYNWDDVQVIEYNPNDGSIVFGPTAISALSDPNAYIDKRLWRWESGTYYPDATLMEKYKGYWVKAKKANVFLRFQVINQVSLSNPATYFARLLINGKRWMKRWVFTPDVAIADSDDSPPRPMGDFSTVSPESVGGCFIATAVYGSPMESHVRILRDFRDTYLLNSTIGHMFVKAYYQYSPPVADFIAKHKALKAAARMGLLPMVAFCYSALHFGLAVTTCGLLIIFMPLIFLVLVYKRRV